MEDTLQLKCKKCDAIIDEDKDDFWIYKEKKCKPHKVVFYRKIRYKCSKCRHSSNYFVDPITKALTNGECKKCADHEARKKKLLSLARENEDLIVSKKITAVLESLPPIYCYSISVKDPETGEIVDDITYRKRQWKTKIKNS